MAAPIAVTKKSSDSAFDWNSFAAFVDEFKEESDRAAVILGAAKLDTLLAQILERRLLPSSASADELLDGDSPLSTFSSRINACYRLGLISADFAKALHLVRRIRNSFAHEVSGVSLGAGPHADRVKSLLLPVQGLHFFKRFREHFFGEEETPGTNFRTCLALMTGRLEVRLQKTEPIDSKEAWSFPVKSWSDDKLSKDDNAESAT